MTIVFISLEPWDDIWRRNQFFCDGILSRNVQANILFVQPAHDNSFALRKGKFHAVRARPTLTPGGYENRLQLLTPTKWFPNSVSVGRVKNQNRLSTEITSALRRLHWSPTHLWINQHEAAHLVDKRMAVSTIYDITDDWTKFSGNQNHIETIVRQDEALCKSCDHVIVCSQQLYADKALMVKSGHLHLIPNGVHVDHYESVGDRTLPIHRIADPWFRPVIGYTGTIHEDRVDVHLVQSIARAYPQATIALVGPNLLSRSTNEELDQLDNVVLTGAVSYTELPDVMRAFDICIVPHHVNPFTESLNPIKLWEFFAVGKPIVSTNVAGFRDFPDVVSVASSADDFICRIEKALKSDDLQLQRKQLAKSHTWDQRISDVLTILTDRNVSNVG